MVARPDPAVRLRGMEGHRSWPLRPLEAGCRCAPALNSTAIGVRNRAAASISGYGHRADHHPAPGTRQARMMWPATMMVPPAARDLGEAGGRQVPLVARYCCATGGLSASEILTPTLPLLAGSGWTLDLGSYCGITRAAAASACTWSTCRTPNAGMWTRTQ